MFSADDRNMDDALCQWRSARAALAASVQTYLDACSSFEATCARFFESRELDITRPDVRQALDEEIPFLALLETSVASARTNLLRLKNISSVISPIARLPTEILARIFALAVTSYRTFRPGARPRDLSVAQLNTIASVCCHWRNAALETATLWSYIDCETLNCLDHARLWLNRAMDCPLDILTTSHLRRTSLDGPRTSTFPHLIPHINNLRSIILFSDSETTQAWVSEWCRNGATRTLTTLAITNLNRDLAEFPVKAESVPQQCLDELLYSISTIYLTGLRINWDLFTCRNLGTLCLMNTTVAIESLSQVLWANPKLEYIHFSGLSTTKPISTLGLPLIELQSLHTLELENVDFDDICYLLANLMPGSRAFNLKLLSVGNWFSSAMFRYEFLELCRRSNVKTLCCPISEALEHVIDVVPRLEVLAFNRMGLSGSVYDVLLRPASDNTQMLPERANLRLPHLHTLYANECHFIDADGLRRFISTYSIQRIEISEEYCTVGDHEIYNTEDLERWIGLEVNVGYLPADWDLGYAPFASF